MRGLVIDTFTLLYFRMLSDVKASMWFPPTAMSKCRAYSKLVASRSIFRRTLTLHTTQFGDATRN